MFRTLWNSAFDRTSLAFFFQSVLDLQGVPVQRVLKNLKAQKCGYGRVGRRGSWALGRAGLFVWMKSSVLFVDVR